jgi:hypothetical protein
MKPQNFEIVQAKLKFCSHILKSLKAKAKVIKVIEQKGMILSRKFHGIS